ncbi:hypothetical protein AAE478_009944 [Parahypoxylon ruwenzoriense]
MTAPVKVVHQGMANSTNGMFPIATLQGEYVLVTDCHKVAEYLKAPDSVLNAQDGANDQQQIPYTMGYGVGHKTYHTQVVRGPITKDIGPKTPMMVEEASLAFADLIGLPEGLRAEDRFVSVVTWDGILDSTKPQSDHEFSHCLRSTPVRIETTHITMKYIQYPLIVLV